MTRSDSALARRALARSALPILCCASVLALASREATAQREVAELKWARHAAAVEYGAVRVGDHGLDALPVGGTWRMGQNLASVLRTEVPLLPRGDGPAIPPGSYRVAVERRGESELGLVCYGAGVPLGGSAADARLTGSLGEGPETKKLEIAWRFVDAEGKATKPEEPMQSSSLEIAFGGPRLVVAVDVVAASTEKLRGGFLLDLFSWPVERFDAQLERGGIVVARLRRAKPGKDEPAAWNLVVDEQAAKLVPEMVAPTDSFGFGPVVPPAEEHTIEGEVVWRGGPGPVTGEKGDDDGGEAGDDAASEGEQPPLTASSIEAGKDGLTVELAVGSRALTVEIELPGRRR
jgi:hypothetical protein